MASVLIIAKPYDAELVRRTCVEAGIQAQVAGSKDRVGRWVEQHHPSVAVISTRLGGADPAQVLADLRAGPHGRAMPVILISDAEGEEGRGLEAQADAFVAHPLNPGQLLMRMQALMVEAQRQRIRAKHAQVVEADYFTLLEVHQNASSEEVQQAYQRLAGELDSSRVTPEVEAELSFQLAEIREVLVEAFLVLRDEKIRTAYRENL